MKDHPKGISLGSVGIGGPAKVWAINFQNKLGIEFQFVPYRGAAAIVQDLIAGQIDVAARRGVERRVATERRQAQAVRRAVASTLVGAPGHSEHRRGRAPGFQMTFWHGLWVPAGTPQEAIDKLDAAAVAALADPPTRARLALIGQDIVPREQQTPEALGAHHKDEIEKWWPIIKAAGVKAE